MDISGVPSPGRGEVRFDLLALAGDEAARPKFERLVTDLIKVLHSTAREIRADPGDWGIDTFVGQLDDGAVAVWQSKHFPEPGSALKAHQAQIRESYKSALTQLEAKGLDVVSWTLALPGTMNGDMTKWWDGWRRRALRERPAGFEIQLWQEADLRALLMKPDFAHIRAQYFGTDPKPEMRTTVNVPDEGVYDRALFIRQLHAAGVHRDSPARRAFFNAELLSRDIMEREAKAEVSALASTRSDLEQLWSTRYEEARVEADPDAGGLMPHLYPGVCKAVETHHQTYPSPVLRDTLVHRTGFVHQLADKGVIGWVLDFEAIAAEHVSGE